ncbi:MAG: SagB/ThcOx family dehydrogenase [Candidatus Bathyarchaeota archaeon]|nr:MAG: SagB/ThcOx family dehydrogenase [Candidatus Bathyarchaeota archaeon]
MRDQDLRGTDQARGIPRPPLESDWDQTTTLIDLPNPREVSVTSLDLRLALEQRVSVRKYAEEPLTLGELSWLLWCTQGVKKITDRPATLRLVPSGGACHPFETYLLVNQVDNLAPGLYRFLATPHKLVEISLDPSLTQQIVQVCWDQPFIAKNAVTFIWIFVPYRATWRYGHRGYRSGLIELGHICQNLYLAAEAVSCGVCAIGAFNDEAMARFLDINQHEQIVLYMATVGKKL